MKADMLRPLCFAVDSVRKFGPIVAHGVQLVHGLRFAVIGAAVAADVIAAVDIAPFDRGGAVAVNGDNQAGIVAGFGNVEILHFVALWWRCFAGLILAPLHMLWGCWLSFKLSL